MRLITWNCGDAFNRKFGHLERLNPDIAILQEVRPECLAFAAVAERSDWLGDTNQKGLAVIAYNGWRLSRAECPVAERWFLPMIATKNDSILHLVAVWVDSARDCAPPTLRALEQLTDFIRAEPCIIAGDFNQSVVFDKGNSKNKRYAAVLKELEILGLRSAWHSHHGQDHGAETAATLYWRWNEQSKYHIDFVFGSNALQIESATLGGFEQYVGGKISDHVPLAVDYAF